MRKLLTLMLSLALALPASASMGALPQPCPMHDMTSMSAADEADMDMGKEEAAIDCCNDLATALRTGKTCKTGLECGGMASMALPMLPTLSLVTTHVEPAIWFQTTPPPVRLSAIWRPPAQI